jgi:hypothetical protein
VRRDSGPIGGLAFAGVEEPGTHAEAYVRPEEGLRHRRKPTNACYGGHFQIFIVGFHILEAGA